MKLLFRTALFHIFSIIAFSLIYLYYKDDFQPSKNTDRDYKSFINFLNLSVTIQSSVGLTDLVPISEVAKFIVMSQQILLIFTHILTLYIFTL